MADLRQDPDYTLYRPIVEKDRRFYWMAGFFLAIDCVGPNHVHPPVSLRPLRHRVE